MNRPARTHVIGCVADLPLRNGVGASCVALPAGPWPTIADFLCERFAVIARSVWHARIQQGEVFEDNGALVTVTTPYRTQAKIYYYRHVPTETRIPFDEVVLYRDDLLIAVDKPHFLPVTPAGGYLQETLLVRLRRSLQIDTLAPMHRIDRDTAGLVLFTVQPDTRHRYQGLFRDRLVRKSYEAIAPWQPERDYPLAYSSRLVESAAFMQMQETPGLPNAHTTITPLEVRGALARYHLQPATGQKHQLRVHMAALGMPILNDRIYPTLVAPLAPDSAPDYTRPLQLLARTLGFTDPVTGQERFFESTLRLQGSDVDTGTTEKH